MAEHAILIVEDDSTVRELLKYRLQKHYNVFTASNGEDALARIEERVPDLIISDIMMPKMDGFALQAALQADKNMRVIPFIFLTARADEPTRREGARTGVDDYITKPFDMDQLLSRIERLLERMQVYQTKLDAKIGRDFSNRLMPKRLPEVDGYRVRFHSEAREQGGGDLFDWTMTEDGTYFITVGDVMGKGLHAKFYAFSFLAYVRAALHSLLEESTASPALFMERINRVLLDDEVLEDTFASLLLLHWDPKKHTITYANAGHCRPVMATPNGAEIIAHSDLILGLESQATFNDATIQIPEGGALVVYTDGIIEQPMPGGGMLGEDGLMSLAASARSADDPIRALRSQALSRSGTDAFNDDALVFWLQRMAHEPEAAPQEAA